MMCISGVAEAFFQAIVTGHLARWALSLSVSLSASLSLTHQSVVTHSQHNLHKLYDSDTFSDCSYGIPK